MSRSIVMYFRLFLRVTIIVCGLMAANANAGYAGRVDVEALIAELVEEHQFEAQDLRAVFRSAQHDPAIIKAISRPAEKSKQWFEYRNIFLDQKRIDSGLVFWKAHTDVLKRAEQQYSVPAEVIVAIIGVETRYGKRAGSYRVIDALSTLGFDYPRRRKFFRKELKEFLLLCREENKNPGGVMGSYAGAMGYGQFMPSSYRHYAVDFDGDGARDIWNNPVDAIGSVGNYLRRHGWQRGGQIAHLAQNVDDAVFSKIASRKLSLSTTVAELKTKGSISLNLNDELKVALFRMQASQATEYWLGLHNFYVITRYNHSHMYALAVYQLATEIAQARSNTKADLARVGNYAN